MSRRFSRISLALVCFLSTQVWALGLGEIKLHSALNEPLRAEIQLLSATPEELSGLRISLASPETFERYGLDRPLFLQGLEFRTRSSGSADGSIVEVRSNEPVTEPFITFLVEASWARGRLLREYTLLLDPPTFAPRAQSVPAVTAPTRSQPADSGRIERPAPSRAEPPEKVPERTSPVQAAEPPVQAPTRTPVEEPAPEPEAEAQPEPAPAEPEAEVTQPEPEVEVLQPEPQAERTEQTAETRVTEPEPEAEPEQEIAEAEVTEPVAQSVAEAVETPAARQPVAEDLLVEETLPPSVESGGEYLVVANETLWGISSRMRPTARVSMEQTMLAIFEANPEAFGGNINILREGASLRIPSESEIIRIGRESAVSGVQRQHEAWQPGSTVVAEPEPEVSEPEPLAQQPIDDTARQPDLTLVPPDEEDLAETAFDDASGEETVSPREQEIVRRIEQLEAADVPIQQSLIQIRDNELAALREELARIRGEEYEPEQEDPFLTDTARDEPAAVADTEAAETAPEAEAPVRPSRRAEPTLGEKIAGVLTSWMLWIIVVVLIVVALLYWFMRRGGHDDTGASWQAIDSEEEDLSSEHEQALAKTLRLPVEEEQIEVVEEDLVFGDGEETVESPAPYFKGDTVRIDAAEPVLESEEGTVEFNSLEDTFSSESAGNLDQTDPIAEADFHMAYGLYDQAAELVDAALASEPERMDLLAKLCEIYFVWGKRDGFVDAAKRLKAVVGDAQNSEWDKIIIMGQQIAADNELFAGAEVDVGDQSVDLDLDTEAEDAASLDMDFDAEGDGEMEIVDVGDGEVSAADNYDMESDLDFNFEGADDAANAGDQTDITAQMPSAPESTVEAPTIEQPFNVSSEDAELPSVEDDDESAAANSDSQSTEATAEINLDDLGLDLDDLEGLDGLDDVEVSLDDSDDSDDSDDLDATGELPSLVDSDREQPPLDDADATGSHKAMDEDSTSVNETVDEDLLEAATSDESDEKTIEDDEATVLSRAYNPDADDAADEDEFDYAKTEALPSDAFSNNADLDETGELPAVASTDVDLDLDDLTAALQVSEMGDTLEQIRDDATVEQPRPDLGALDSDDPDDDFALTQALDSSPGEEEDLEDAHTMTEVGTKLDLARAYVDMGDPSGARAILEEVLEEGDESQQQQAQQLLDTLPS